MEGWVSSAYGDAGPGGRGEPEELDLAGRLGYRGTVAEGLVKATAAFIGMLRGENVGKQHVRLA